MKYFFVISFCGKYLKRINEPDDPKVKDYDTTPYITEAMFITSAIRLKKVLKYLDRYVLITDKFEVYTVNISEPKLKDILIRPFNF